MCEGVETRRHKNNSWGLAQKIDDAISKRGEAGGRVILCMDLDVMSLRCQ